MKPFSPLTKQRKVIKQDPNNNTSPTSNLAQPLPAPPPPPPLTVIDEEDPAVGVNPLLPAIRQGAQLVVGPLRLARVVRQRRRLAGPRVDPRRGLVTVVCAWGKGVSVSWGLRYKTNVLCKTAFSHGMLASLTKWRHSSYLIC